ncbi:CaiB/BaiF CoA transferase family protein [Nitratireductor soli]|uniref:CaiB/BaiF CoA transferase family protein n=1 Tax=Nitratireductor soli TaxID=1670619 RepID=UPI00065DE46D|nr:CoA transferase [Nitratireductor soli]
MENKGKNLLEGVRILDLTRVMSGPFCTAMLADLGAEVIKIEMPGFGEEGRHFAPFKDDLSTYFMLLNRGKKSVALNLKDADGVKLARELAATCDVVVENFRPGVAARLGLDHETLRGDNPKLVYASISGFGQEGPLANWPAFDLVIQAMSGLMSITGERDGRAMAVGESFADVATGMFASWGILAALFDRERTGEGRYLDVAMLDSVFSMLLTGLSRQLYTGADARRVGNRHPETYPVDSFSAADGDFVLVGFSDSAFRAIVSAIGRPELADDPRFSDNKARNAHEGELRAAIAEWAAGRPRAQAVEALQKAGVPSGPVWSLGDVVASPHAQARGLVSTGQNAVLGDIPLVRQPVHFHGAPAPEAQRAPLIGEDTDTVLTTLLGLDAGRIADLRNKKAIA